MVDTIVRLGHNPAELLYVPGENKLYVSTRQNRLLVLDCATYETIANIPTHGNTPCAAYGVWNWRRDKIYYSFNIRPDSIMVIDASADTVLKWIPFAGVSPLVAYVSSTDRVYLADRDLYVLDCAADTWVRVIPPQPDDHFGFVWWDSVGNKVYVGSGWNAPDLLMAYSCENDSLVARFSSGTAHPYDMVFNTDRRKAYVQGFWGGVSAIDTRADTLIRTYRGRWLCDGVWNSVEDKVYMRADTDSGTIYVIDCASDSVVRKIWGDWVRYVVEDLCWAPWSNLLYVAWGSGRHFVSVIDCRNDSVVVPGLEMGPSFMAASEENRRVYVSAYWDSSIYVLRDESPAVEEARPGPQPAWVMVSPSPFARCAYISYALTSKADVNLSIVSATGRVVDALVHGRQSAGVHRVPWDVSLVPAEHLPNGVYFCRLQTGRWFATRKLALVR